MQVSFTIDDNIKDQLQAIADEQGRPLSNLIKKMIKDYLMKHNYTNGGSGEKKPYCNNCEKVLSKEEFGSPIHSGHLITLRNSSISNTERSKKA